MFKFLKSEWPLILIFVVIAESGYFFVYKPLNQTIEDFESSNLEIPKLAAASKLNWPTPVALLLSVSELVTDPKTSENIGGEKRQGIFGFNAEALWAGEMLDGNILVVGRFNQFSGEDISNMVIFGKNGRLLRNFSSEKVNFGEEPVFLLDREGALVIAPNAGSQALVRILPDGTRDEDFTPQLSSWAKPEYTGKTRISALGMLGSHRYVISFLDASDNPSEVLILDQTGQVLEGESRQVVRQLMAHSRLKKFSVTSCCVFSQGAAGETLFHVGAQFESNRVETLNFQLTADGELRFLEGAKGLLASQEKKSIQYSFSKREAPNDPEGKDLIRALLILPNGETLMLGKFEAQLTPQLKAQNILWLGGR